MSYYLGMRMDYLVDGKIARNRESTRQGIPLRAVVTNYRKNLDRSFCRNLFTIPVTPVYIGGGTRVPGLGQVLHSCAPTTHSPESDHVLFLPTRIKPLHTLSTSQKKPLSTS